MSEKQFVTTDDLIAAQELLFEFNTQLVYSVAKQEEMNRHDLLHTVLSLLSMEPFSLSTPEVEAALTSHNLLNREERRTLAERAATIASQYRVILTDDSREEDLQVFLKQHPQILYPDFIHVYPKFKLGSEFVTDFVFHVQGVNGAGYVFVEIEKAAKPVFTAAGHFSSEFTQAKNQLLDWEAWVTQNQNYLQRTLPSLFKPHFHLVMGRNNGLLEEQRKRLATEFNATTRSFSTYDDVIQRYEQIVTQLHEGRESD